MKRARATVALALALASGCSAVGASHTTTIVRVHVNTGPLAASEAPLSPDPPCGTLREQLAVTVPGVEQATDLQLGFGHSCARRADGSVTCWGFNGGMLGRCGARADGSAWCHDDFPESDWARVYGAFIRPTVFTGLRGFVEQLAFGDEHGCVRYADGAVACWGWNRFGQLGDGATPSDALFSAQARAVLGLRGATQIAAGSDGSCAIVADGAVACWGTAGLRAADAGVFARGPSTATLIPGITGARQVALGGSACALLEGGVVRCWVGPLGRMTLPVQVAAPPLMAGIPAVVEIAAGCRHQCARGEDGSVWCWGRDTRAQASGQAPGHGWDDVPPGAVPGVHDATQLALGCEHSCALLRDGTVRCWGWNHYGQLGDGTREVPQEPVAVRDLDGVVRIAAGSNHTCAIVRDGTVRCWGNNAQCESRPRR